MSMTKHNGFKINIKNLTKLRDYLMSLPRNYKDFNMESFMVIDDRELYMLSGEPMNIDDFRDYAVPIINGCGTVACAVGHGPAAGIKARKSESWNNYANRTLIEDGDCEYDIWDWCFSETWAWLDNHHYGAARRISYLIDNLDVPDFWKYDDMELVKKKYPNFKKSNRIGGKNASS